MRVSVRGCSNDAFWVAAVSQCGVEDLDEAASEQKHQPVAFLSSAFRSSQAHWSTYRKGAYELFQTFQRLNYLLGCAKQVTAFTDHLNLLSSFILLQWNHHLGGRRYGNLLYARCIFMRLQTTLKCACGTKYSGGHHESFYARIPTSSMLNTSRATIAACVQNTEHASLLPITPTEQ